MCSGCCVVGALGASDPLPNTPDPDPVAGIYGNTGLWKVFTAETLRTGQASFSTWYDRIHRDPGHLTISTFGFGAAVGITDRLEAGVNFEANRHARVGQPEQLSLGQQALGFFGNRTSGSPPLPSELLPDSSRVPQLRFPPIPAGALTGAAGYYNLLPFAGLVRAGGATGLVSLGAKYSILSENTGGPFGLAVHSYLGVPIHKGIDFLLMHPVGTGDLQFGFDGIVSKNIGETAQLDWNAGYRHINQPAHVSVFRLAEEVPLGFGLTIPRTGRVVFMLESTAEVFFGNHTPNTSFGPEDPVDVTAGLRARLTRSFSFSAGYRRPLNQFGGDRNGFVVSVTTHN